MLNKISIKLWGMSHHVFSARTVSAMKFDVQRLRARRIRRKDKGLVPPQSKLHVGCGEKRVQGWLNVDVAGSEYDVDLGGGRLPWAEAAFEAAASEHVIEHLELKEQVLPLLRELHRVLKPGGELWLSCPDIEKICRSYLDHRMVDLLEDRRKRWPEYSQGDMPSSHMINHLFHQNGRHKNLFDYELLAWTLKEAGFTRAERMVEADLLQRFPEFPPRHDDLQSVYVQAIK